MASSWGKLQLPSRTHHPYKEGLLQLRVVDVDWGSSLIRLPTFRFLSSPEPHELLMEACKRGTWKLDSTLCMVEHRPLEPGC